MPIKNIIFDYGGVIIDLDYHRTKVAFEELGAKNFDQHFTQLQQSSLFDLLDKGKISENNFRNRIRETTGIQATNEQIDHAWNAMLLGIDENKLRLLKSLKYSYRTFLLSNTNLTHLKAITKYLQRSYSLVNLDNYFEKVYYSCTLGMRKPEPEIFQKIISDNHLHSSETLFIDDSPQHVEGGKNAGMNSVLYRKSESLENLMNQFLPAPSESN